MSTSKPSPERRPADHDPAPASPVAIIDLGPFPDERVGMRRVLHALHIRGTRPRTSSETLTGSEEPVGAPRTPPRPATPAPASRPSSSSSASPTGYRTPESERTATRLHVVEVETSSPSSSPRSRRSVRSVDTEGDARMINAAFSGAELARLQMREDIQAAVRQGAHDNFEFERGRLAAEVTAQVLATIGEGAERAVRERIDHALRSAVGAPVEGETDAIIAVRERLARMSDEARVKVFCTEEMLVLLRRVVALVDLELRTQSWTMVGNPDQWE
ncbi:hypothetical protein CSOJ01_11332 [Colletotrichum sojae]|uniref:Uncharacterized protein n=1 Tax=Colletotrichum sojae TaxID=2175907 RepID=A0A8H6IXV2_9PEZI|nr:hypothetical protein CSOJ01_11332 [Colletotrichum sojae]